jgi:hypothetical protein
MITRQQPSHLSEVARRSRELFTVMRSIGVASRRPGREGTLNGLKAEIDRLEFWSYSFAQRKVTQRYEK